MDRHDMMCKYTLHIALEKNITSVTTLSRPRVWGERVFLTFGKRREIFYYSQKHPTNALRWFLILPVYFISSHVRGRRWLAFGFPVDQTVSWCWSAPLHRSPVKLGWLTPADSLAPDRLSAEGCGICYPFGVLVNVCLTLKVHFAVLIKFQSQDGHKLT